MSRLLNRCAARTAVGAAVTITVMAVAGPAQAIGNNRILNRSCGQNYVSSGLDGSGGGWAQTRRASGDCSGRLSAALQLSDGYWTERKYGDRNSAYAAYARNASFQPTAAYGLHWGCDSCSVTYS